MVDLAFLRKFTKGNEAKMKRYIDMYLQTAPEIFRQMQEHLSGQNWTQLAISAHSLKPQADFMGIADLKAVLIEMEEEVKQGRFDQLDSLFQKAWQIHRQSEEELVGFL